MSNVKYPEMRAQVIASLRALSDPEYQQRVWIERQFPHEQFYDDLRENIGMLYDTSLVLDAPATRVGDILVDDSEVVVLEELRTTLTPVIDDLGDADDGAYMRDVRWPAVVATAEAARRLLEANLDSTEMWGSTP